MQPRSSSTRSQLDYINTASEPPGSTEHLWPQYRRPTEYVEVPRLHFSTIYKNVRRTSSAEVLRYTCSPIQSNTLSLHTTFLLELVIVFPSRDLIITRRQRRECKDVPHRRNFDRKIFETFTPTCRN